MSKSFKGWGKYVGDWNNGKRHGNGTFTTSDGSSYTGQFKDGLEHGSGTYSGTSGTRYEGEWGQGKYHGEGVLITSDGYQVHGEFRKGKLWIGVKCDESGSEIEKIYRGDSYDGETENNVPHGKGILTSENGDKYEGYFVRGEKNGGGRLTTREGNSEYIGTFSKGKRSGQGVEFSTSAVGTWKYEGEFENDKPHGLGTETCQEIDDEWSFVYVGEFVDGAKCGHGELVRGDGTKFVGEFRDDAEWEGKVYDQQGNPWYPVTEGK